MALKIVDVMYSSYICLMLNAVAACSSLYVCVMHCQ
jgi:hypothetical protein